MSDKVTDDNDPGPSAGHRFFFEVDIQGAFRVGHGPYEDSPRVDPAEEPPLRLSVRAWDLQEALRKAAKQPLEAWFPTETASS